MLREIKMAYLNKTQDTLTEAVYAVYGHNCAAEECLELALKYIAQRSPADFLAWLIKATGE